MSFSVILPDGITTIGSCAFNGCLSLQEINIPSSVTAIDLYAFDNRRGYLSKLLEELKERKLLPSTYPICYTTPPGERGPSIYQDPTSSTDDWI